MSNLFKPSFLESSIVAASQGMRQPEDKLYQFNNLSLPWCGFSHVSQGEGPCQGKNQVAAAEFKS